MTDGDFITSRHSGKVTHSRLNKMIRNSRQASFKTQSHHFRAVVLYNVSKRYQTWAQRSYERPVEIPRESVQEYRRAGKDILSTSVLSIEKPGYELA